MTKRLSILACHLSTISVTFSTSVHRKHGRHVLIHNITQGHIWNTLTKIGERTVLSSVIVYISKSSIGHIIILDHNHCSLLLRLRWKNSEHWGWEEQTWPFLFHFPISFGHRNLLIIRKFSFQSRKMFIIRKSSCKTVYTDAWLLCNGIFQFCILWKGQNSEKCQFLCETYRNI